MRMTCYLNIIDITELTIYNSNNSNGLHINLSIVTHILITYKYIIQFSHLKIDKNVHRNRS